MGKQLIDAEIILIDSKDYFENTIAVLNIFLSTDINNSIKSMMKVAKKHTNYLPPKVIFIKGIVKEITETKVLLEDQTIYFDYAVIASGTRNKNDIKAFNLTSNMRVDSLTKHGLELMKCDNILIVGGGLVGVELGAEICTKYPQKRLMIVTSTNRLLERMKPKVSEEAHKWFNERNVQIIYNEKVEQSKNNPNKFKLEKSKITMLPDKVFWCTGYVPNSDFVKKNFPESVTKDGFIKVNDYLQLKDTKNIFVLGDVADLKEEKMAQRAISQANYISKKIKKIINHGSVDKKYVSPKKPPLIVISLGPTNALMCNNYNFTMQGKVAVAVKKWTFRNMMAQTNDIVKIDKRKIKVSKSKLSNSTNSINLKNTRLSIEQLSDSDEIKIENVTVFSNSSTITVNLSEILAAFEIKVNLILEKNNLNKNLTSKIKKYNINSFIVKSNMEPFKLSSVWIFHITPYKSKIKQNLENLVPFLLDSFEKGILKKIIILHEGYLLEKSGKHTNLALYILEIEEIIRNINPKIIIISVRHTPTFEFLFSMTQKNKIDTSITNKIAFSIPKHGIAFISKQDLIDFVVKIACNDTDSNIFNICGSTRLTYDQIMMITSEEVGVNFIFETGDDEIITSFKNIGFTNEEASDFVQWHLNHSRYLSKTTTDFENILGKKSIDLNNWVNLNNHLFI